MHKPQPTDISKISLQGTLNELPMVQNVATTSGVWTSITLEYDESKQMILQPRANIEWYVSPESAGDYFTMRPGTSLQMPVVAVSGTVLCWVMANEDTTFELLVGR